MGVRLANKNRWRRCRRRRRRCNFCRCRRCRRRPPSLSFPWRRLFLSLVRDTLLRERTGGCARRVSATQRETRWSKRGRARAARVNRVAMVAVSVSLLLWSLGRVSSEHAQGCSVMCHHSYKLEGRHGRLVQERTSHGVTSWLQPSTCWTTG